MTVGKLGKRRNIGKRTVVLRGRVSHRVHEDDTLAFDGAQTAPFTPQWCPANLKPDTFEQFDQRVQLLARFHAKPLQVSTGARPIWFTPC